MKTKNIQLAFFIIGTILFNWFFWHEELGLNLLLYNLFIIGTSIVIYPKSKTKKTVLTTAMTSVITSIMVFIYGTTIAKFTNILSLFIFIGYVHQPQVKAIFYALFTSFINFFTFPIKQFFIFSDAKKGSSMKYLQSLKKLRLILIPSVFLYLFYWIFKFANPKFNELTIAFWLKYNLTIEWLFSDISFFRISFFIVGALIIASFIYHNNILFFIKKESKLNDIVVRKRVKLVKHIVSKTGLNSVLKPLSFGLKNEYHSALFLIGTVNLLLLLVNYLDISWLWFNFEYSNDFNLSQFVHEGTYLLILSVLLSIGIIFYFFRKNLNFFPNNNLLKRLSILWILQNIILVISVGIRNYHYINYYGLAYKRIGVMVFLLLTLIGLITLIFKITQLKSSFYLVKQNAISVFVVFILMSFFNWDVIIAKHNLKNYNSKTIDISFLLTLSDNTLPLIDQHRAILKQNNETSYYREDYELIFKERVNSFQNKQANLSWLSMNLTTEKTKDYFNNLKN